MRSAVGWDGKGNERIGYGRKEEEKRKKKKKKEGERSAVPSRSSSSVRYPGTEAPELSSPPPPPRDMFIY